MTAIRTLLGAAIVAMYPLVSFYPYAWDPPSDVMPRLLPGGGINFPLSGIAQLHEPPEWLSEAMGSQQLDIALTVKSAPQHQWGPARILTVSRDPFERNFTVGQEEDDLIFRLRSSYSDRNGMPELRVPDVFSLPGWHELRFSIQPDRVRIAVDGRWRLQRPLPWGALRMWDRSYRLALGNEITGGRPWFGQVRHAVVRTRTGAIDYAAPGVLEIPSWRWHFRLKPRALEPLEITTRDVFRSVAGFMPLGLVIGGCLRNRGAPSVWTGLLLLLITAVMLEGLQLGFPNPAGAYRIPAAKDMFLNALGGGLGIMLPHQLARMRVALPLRLP